MLRHGFGSVACMAGLALSLQGLASSFTPAQAAGRQPAEIASTFCSTRLAGDDEGVRALLTPALLAAIMEAEDRNLAAMQAAPDQKPPFGDGIPYQSFPDLPDECTAGAAEPAGDGYRIPVALTFKGSPSAGWSDALVLAGHDGAYLIDDIVFRGSPDARRPPTLRSLLRDSFDW